MNAINLIRVELCTAVGHVYHGMKCNGWLLLCLKEGVNRCCETLHCAENRVAQIYEK